MLPLLAILLFSLIGIGAMVIDGGLALSEQQRLEIAAEMMVSEWAHVQSLPDDALPSECVTSGARRTECLEAAYLAPLLAPMGVEMTGSGTNESLVQTSETALDGRVVDTRGARFGALEVEGVLDDGSAENIRLSRSSPLLFGWATIPAEGRTEGRPDFLDVQAARAEQGLAPDLDGSGLYGEGFSLNAAAATHPIGVPALRIGPPIPDTATTGHYLTAGAVGVAWLLSDLQRTPDSPRLITALESTSNNANQFDIVGQRLETPDGHVVACLFGADGAGAYVGQPIGSGVTALSATQWPSAYVAVVEDCDADSPILGFLEIGIDAQMTNAVRVSPSADLRRNATASPGLAGPEAMAASQTLQSDGRARLEATPSWRPNMFDLALRVPQVVNVQ